MKTFFQKKKFDELSAIKPDLRQTRLTRWPITDYRFCYHFVSCQPSTSLASKKLTSSSSCFNAFKLYSQRPLYGHPLNTDTLLPFLRVKKALTFPLNSTRLTRSLSMTPSVSELTGFDCTPKSVRTVLSLSKGFSEEFQVAMIAFDR